MSDYREKECVVPSGAFDFSAEGGLVGVGAEHVEGEFSQDREVFGTMIFSVSGPVLVEHDIEDPVELVLDSPVRGEDFEHMRGAKGLG